MKSFPGFAAAIVLLLSSACAAGTAAPTPNMEATMAVALEQTMAAQPTSTETITPSPEPTSTTAPPPTAEEIAYSVESLENGWSRYTSNSYGIEISLPPEYTLLDITSEEFDEMLMATSETNPEIGEIFSSAYVRNLAAAGIKFLAVDTSVESLSTTIPTSMNILIAPLPIEISLDDYIEVNINQIRNMLGEDIAVEKEITEVNGIEAGKISYQLSINDLFGDPQPVYYVQYLMLVDQIQYVITLGTNIDLAETNQPIFEGIGQSFALIPQ